MMTLDTNQKPVVNYPLTLTTLTPVCVKSHDEPLSPLADYVQDGEQIHYIDQQKFLRKLSERELVDAYANMVAKVTIHQKGKHDEFKQFLDENDIQVKDIISISRPYFGKGNPTQVSRHIHSSGRVYIPGSTLKGAVTTALFFYWMKSNRRLWEHDIKDILNKYWNQKGRLINGGKQKDGNDSWDLNQLKKVTKKQLSNKYAFLFDRYLNRQKSDNAYNFASLYGFTDTGFTDDVNIEISDFFRYNINPKNSLSSQLFEIIKEDVNLDAMLSIQVSPLFKEFKGTGKEYKEFELAFFKDKDLSPLFKKINDFSLCFLDSQIEFVSAIKSFNKTNFSDLYLEQLIDLKNKAIEMSGSSAIVAIGFGKSFLQSTIAMLLDAEMKKRLLSLNRNASDKKNAPTTFYMDEDGIPLSWCKIELK